MKNLQVKPSYFADFFKGENVMTVLHDGARKLFWLYAMYETVNGWIDCVLSAHYTVVGGLVDGIFSDKNIKNIKSYNDFRSRAYRERIISNINILNKVRQLHPSNKITDEDIKNMILKGDLSKLKALIQSDLGDDFSTNRLRAVETIERYPFALRNFILYHINKILDENNKNTLIQSKMPTENKNEEFCDKLQKFLDKQSKLKPDDLLKKLLQKVIRTENLNFVSSTQFSKMLFSVGKWIGEQTKLDQDNKVNKLKQLIELSVLVTVYVCLYLGRMLKNIVLKPIDILKFIILGFINGVDKNILPENDKINKLLIDFKHPLDSLVFSFETHYESLAASNDRFEYSSGKTCAMKVLEKIIATKTEYLIRYYKNPDLDKIAEVAQYNIEMQTDIGQAIHRDNPIACLFALINTFDELVSKLAVTLGDYMGRNCKSFSDYVSSKVFSQTEIQV